MDRIFIRELRCRGILGIHPGERTTPQEIVIGVVLEADTRPAAASEEIADAVDYAEVAAAVRDLAQTGGFLLVETLCARIAELCLADRRVTACEVTVEKPTALPFAGGVGVTIRRERGG